MSVTSNGSLAAVQSRGNDRIAAGCIALVYGLALASLPLELFKDRESYLRYATDSLTILEALWHVSPLAAMANEPAWLLLNHFLSIAFEPEGVVRALIAIPAVTVAWLTLSNAEGRISLAWFALLLLLPQVVKNHIIHLRQGVAIAVFLAGWFTASRPVRALCFSIAPLIHVSFAAVIGLTVVVWVLNRIRASVHLRLFVGVMISAALGLGLRWLAFGLEIRQAEEYDFVAKEVSGLGFVLWFTVLVLMLAQGHRFIIRNTFALFSLALYLSLYFVVEISARVFESSLLIVLMAMLTTTGLRLRALQAIILFVLLFQYVTQANQPAVGFGSV